MAIRMNVPNAQRDITGEIPPWNGITVKCALLDITPINWTGKKRLLAHARHVALVDMRTTKNRRLTTSILREAQLFARPALLAVGTADLL